MYKDTVAGFNTVVSMVEGLEEFAGHQVRIQAKNENYVAERVGFKGEQLEILACTPDLISVVDSDTGERRWKVGHVQIRAWYQLFVDRMHKTAHANGYHTGSISEQAWELGSPL